MGEIGKKKKSPLISKKGRCSRNYNCASLAKDLPVPQCYQFLVSPMWICVYTLPSGIYILPTCPPNHQVTPLSLNLQHNPYLIWKAPLFPKAREGAPFLCPPPTCVCLSLFFHCANDGWCHATCSESTKGILYLALGSIDVGSFEKKLEISSLGQRASVWV